MDKAVVEHYLLLIKVYRSIVADNDLYILFTMLSHLNIRTCIQNEPQQKEIQTGGQTHRKTYRQVIKKQNRSKYVRKKNKQTIRNAYRNEFIQK